MKLSQERAKDIAARIRYFFRWLYTLNAWIGCERLTWWDKVYLRRVGIKSAWEIAGYIQKVNKNQ